LLMAQSRGQPSQPRRSALDGTHSGRPGPYVDGVASRAGQPFDSQHPHRCSRGRPLSAAR
jgi:hypothetical protein